MSDLETVQGIASKYGKTKGNPPWDNSCQEMQRMQGDQDVKIEIGKKEGQVCMILADFSDDMLRAAQHDRNKSDTV